MHGNGKESKETLSELGLVWGGCSSIQSYSVGQDTTTGKCIQISQGNNLQTKQKFVPFDVCVVLHLYNLFAIESKAKESFGFSLEKVKWGRQCIRGIVCFYSFVA